MLNATVAGSVRPCGRRPRTGRPELHQHVDQLRVAGRLRERALQVGDHDIGRAAPRRDLPGSKQRLSNAVLATRLDEQQMPSEAFWVAAAGAEDRDRLAME